MADMVTETLLLTATGVMGKDGETVLPPVIITVAGTVVLGSLLARVTVTPPAVAGPFKLTVPLVAVPPKTDDGVKVTIEAVSGPTVRVAGTPTPL